MQEASPEDNNRQRKLRMIGMQLLGGAILLATALFLQDLPAVRSQQSCTEPCVPGSEDIMSAKEHGTSHTPVQDDLRWGCDGETADKICKKRVMAHIRNLLVSMFSECGFIIFC
jgi:hypothetical protein